MSDSALVTGAFFLASVVIFLVLRLRVSESRLRLLSEQSSDMVALHDPDGTFLWVSPSVERLLGYSPAELIGVNLYDLIHQDDISAHEPLGDDHTAVYRIRCKNGQHLWIETQFRHVVNSIGQVLRLKTSSRDVSDLHHSEYLYRFLIQHLPDTSVFIFDTHLRHLSAEGPRIDPDGLPMSSLIGRHLWEAFSDDISATLTPFYHQALSGVPHHSEQHFRARTYEVHVLPVYDALGDILSGMAVFIDVTEDRARTRALQDQKSDLQRSNQDLEQFANVASHELKSPVRRISGFAELLMMEYGSNLSSEVDVYLRQIIDGAHDLHTVIGSLLSYSRVQTDRSQFEWVDVNKVFDLAMINLSSLVQERRAFVTKRQLPEMMMSDPTLIQRLFENLVGNAIKFNTTERPPKVLVEVRRTLLYWEFHIEDNGPGIPEGYRDRAFAMFQRLHPEIEGSGIGLALCKKIVHLHLGKIWFESCESGTTFKFQIPALSPSPVTG